MVCNAKKTVLTQQSDSIAGINTARFGVSCVPEETVLYKLMWFQGQKSSWQNFPLQDDGFRISLCFTEQLPVASSQYLVTAVGRDVSAIGHVLGMRGPDLTQGGVCEQLHGEGSLTLS